MGATYGKLLTLDDRGILLREPVPTLLSGLTQEPYCRLDHAPGWQVTIEWCTTIDRQGQVEEREIVVDIKWHSDFLMIWILSKC